MSQTMSITRALAELKTIDKQINKLTNVNYIGTAVGQGEQQKTTVMKSVKELQSELQSNKDTITALFTKRAAIKSAIVQSNATTKVRILGTEYTVAEAIELKSSISAKELLVVTLQNQYNVVSANVTRLNAQLNEEIEKALIASYGADRAKISPEIYASVANPRIEARAASLLDPNNVVEWINKLQEEVDAVTTELNFVLQESNSRTEITI